MNVLQQVESMSSECFEALCLPMRHETTTCGASVQTIPPTLYPFLFPHLPNPVFFPHLYPAPRSFPGPLQGPAPTLQCPCYTLPMRSHPSHSTPLGSCPAMPPLHPTLKTHRLLPRCRRRCGRQRIGRTARSQSSCRGKKE